MLSLSKQFSVTNVMHIKPHCDRPSAATNKLSYIGENNAILSFAKDEQWQTS